LLNQRRSSTEAVDTRYAVNIVALNWSCPADGISAADGGERPFWYITASNVPTNTPPSVYVTVVRTPKHKALGRFNLPVETRVASIETDASSWQIAAQTHGVACPQLATADAGAPAHANLPKLAWSVILKSCRLFGQEHAQNQGVQSAIRFKLNRSTSWREWRSGVGQPAVIRVWKG
jgi:hypothetical protein